MKNILLCGIFIFSLSSLLNAQIKFQKTYGGTNEEYAYSIIQSSDSSYVFTGWTNSFGAGNQDVLLIKINQNGDTVWTRAFGGAQDDKGYSVKQTHDGGYVICGITTSFGANYSDIYIIRTDENGMLLWSKTIGDSLSQTGNCIIETNDNGFIVAGNTFGSGQSVFENYLLKLNENGDLLWTKIYGSIAQETLNFITQTSDKGYILTGTRGTGPYPEDNNVYLLKTDSNGSLIWNHSYGKPGTNGYGRDFGQCVKQTLDGGYIVCGTTNSFGAGNGDAYIIRTNSSGDTLWTKTYGGIDDEFAYEIIPAPDSGFIVIGSSDSYGSRGTDAYLLKLYFDGTVNWVKTFGGGYFDRFYSVKPTFDGGYILAGYTEIYSIGTHDAYVIKTDGNGNSGCLELNPATTVKSPNTQVDSPIINVYSGGFSATPPTQMNSGTSVKLLCSSIGIEENCFSTFFDLYPNPSNGNFIIKSKGSKSKYKIQVLNLFGVNLLNKEVSSVENLEVELEDKADGIYFVQIQQEGVQYTKKIIIYN